MKERTNATGCSCCGVYGNAAFHCVKGYNNKYTTCSDLWTSIYSLLAETLKGSDSTLLQSESLKSVCSEIRWLVSPIHGLMHIAQSMVLTRRSPLLVHTGPKCDRCLRCCDKITDAGKQLCLPCYKTKCFQSNLAYVPPKYVLPQMTEEDPKRKPVTWAFYCARFSWGCYAIEEDHYRTLKEAFTNSVRLVTGIVFFVI